MGALVVSKGYDTFCPLGPVIVTDLDPSNLRIMARVNGVTRQDSNTSDLLFDVPDAGVLPQPVDHARARATSSSPARRRASVPWCPAT